MKYNKFETLWKNAKDYVSFSSSNYVSTYNCFMAALEENANKVEGDDFDSKRFEFFLLSWRHSAKQEVLKYCQGYDYRTVKGFCREVYEAYTYTE
ncbi:TPA: hypothetical protein QDB51_002686 [Burkholderia vietnamiensis]|nr:hypothetical protein [Burkholderia vietnamiensis]